MRLTCIMKTIFGFGRTFLEPDVIKHKQNYKMKGITKLKIRTMVQQMQMVTSKI